MNAHHLITAVSHLDRAIELEIDPNERGILQSINRRLRRVLKKRGVFLGEKQMPCKIPCPNSESGHAKS